MIQKFRQKHTERLIEIFKLNIPQYFAPHELERFEPYLKDHPDTYFVIEDNKEVVGGVGYLTEPKNNATQITWIFLHPLYHRKGLGQQMVQHCFDEIKKQGTTGEISVRTSQYGKALFEKFGFRTIKTRNEYWGKGLHLYEMIVQ